MVHGLEDGADSWILSREDKSPGFVAAEAGYDVWVTNSRGNVYSRGHVRLNESDP
jgi:lysosomal acid lipase/cholesteryl ester hydrolase